MVEKFFYLPRWVLVSIALCFLISGGYYSWQYATEEYENRLESLHHPGEKICVGFTKIVAITYNEILAVDRLGTRYQFISDNKIFHIGQVYSFSGEVTESGKIYVQTYQHHPLRRLKYIFSFCSILIIFFFIFKYIRYDRFTSSLIVKDIIEK